MPNFLSYQNRISYSFFVALLGLLATYSAAADRLVFEARYKIEWKGWTCGSMYSQLWQKEDSTYVYSQHLKSTVFFFPFEQREESQFILKDGNIICKRYDIARDGLDGPSYAVNFHKDYMEVAVQGEDDFTHYAIEGEPVYDKLVTQLVLIREVLQNRTPGDKTVCFVDPSGVHYRTYTLTNEDGGFVFKSNYKSKASAFTLDPKRRYLPVLFEQYRHESLMLTGSLAEVNFGVAWDDFLGPS